MNRETAAKKSLRAHFAEKKIGGNKLMQTEERIHTTAPKVIVPLAAISYAENGVSLFYDVAIQGVMALSRENFQNMADECLLTLRAIIQKLVANDEKIWGQLPLTVEYIETIKKARPVICATPTWPLHIQGLVFTPSKKNETRSARLKLRGNCLFALENPPPSAITFPIPVMLLNSAV